MRDLGHVILRPIDAPHRPRLWKGLAAVLALSGLALIGLWVRGTTVSEPHDPAAASEGATVQLCRQPDGRIVARCSLVAGRPVEEIWSIITAYEQFAKVFPEMSSLSVGREPAGQVHLAGRVATPLGSYPMDVRITHSAPPGSSEWRAQWDGTSGPLTVNRGSWALHALDAGTTRIVYTIEVEMAHVPDFLVRVALLYRIPTMVNAAASAPVPPAPAPAPAPALAPAPAGRARAP